MSWRYDYSGWLWGRLHKGRYDIVYSRKTFRDFMYWLITVIGMQTATPDYYIWYIMWPMLYLIMGVWLYFIDILMPTFAWNVKVYKYRKRKKMAQREEEGIEEESKGSNNRKRKDATS